MKLWIVSVISFVLSFALSAGASPNSLTYQGRIIRSDGTPLEYSSVSFIFQIVDPSGQCVIYQELVNGINMVNSGGVFDVPIGGGTVKYPLTGTFKILDAFNNSSSFTCGDCTSGSCADGSSTYNAVAGDHRILRVQFYDGSGWKTISPDSTIRSVPFAGYALSAQKLGNNIASDFLTKAGLPSCSSGTFLSWNGTSMSCAAVAGASGGTVTSVSGNAPLSVTNNTSTPVISITQASSSTDGYLSSADWNSFNGKQNALGYTPLNPANNLSELSASASTVRTNLGLGSAAVKNAPASGDAAAAEVVLGSDSRLAAANGATASSTPNTLVKRDSSGSANFKTLKIDASSSGTLSMTVPASVTSYSLTFPSALAGANNSVLASDTSGNLTWINLGSIAGVIDLTTQVSGVLPIANGGTGSSTATGARSNLGLGSASTVNTGSAAGNIPVLSTGGLVANQMCVSDGTASGIACNSTIPISSQWITNGSNIYYNTGNVGIGTTTPSTTLDVNGSTTLRGSLNLSDPSGASVSIIKDAYLANSMTMYAPGTLKLRSDGGQIKFYINGGSNEGYQMLKVQPGGIMVGAYDGAASTYSGTGTITGASIGAGNTDGIGANLALRGGAGTGAGRGGYLQFFTAPATTTGNTVNPWIERMRILDGGNVGIGTTSPNFALVVNANSNYEPLSGTTANNGIVVNAYENGTGTVGSNFRNFSARGSFASPSALQTGDTLGSWNSSGYWTGKANPQFINQDTRASISMIATENWSSATNNGTAITFNTTPNNSGAASTERMRIDNTGNVGIGTTTPSEKLEVAGNIKTSGNLITGAGQAFKLLSGTATCSISVSAQSGTGAVCPVTFGYTFSTIPVITAVNTNPGNWRDAVIVNITNKSTTGFSFYFYNASGTASSGSMVVDWTAIGQ